MNGKNAAPQVSIIIPTYNRRHLIQRALESIFAQSYQNFEIIVVDDNSIDNTRQLISDINDLRIKYIYLDKRKGAAFARNVGIKESQGRYIGFADSDDEWNHSKLQKQVDYLINSPQDTGMVYSYVRKVENGSKSLLPEKHLQSTKSLYIHEKLLSGNFITIHSLVRRECLDKIGLFDENLPRLQDWDLWLRISKYYRIGFIDETLATVYMSSDAISRDDDMFIAALEIILGKYIDDYRKYPHILAKKYYLLGRLWKQQGRMDKALFFLRKAAHLKSFNLKYFAYEKFYSFNLKIKRGI